VAAADPPRCTSSASTPTCGNASTSNAATANASGYPTSSWQPISPGYCPASSSSPTATSSCSPSRCRPDLELCDRQVPVGLAALRAERKDHPARHRPTPDTWTPSRPAASSSTSPATKGWVSAGPDRRRSPNRCSRWGNNIHYYAVDHGRRTCGTPPPGRSAKPYLPYLRPVLTGPEHGPATKPSNEPSRSATGSSKTPRILSFQRRSPRVPAPPSGRQRRNTVIFREIADRHRAGPRIARTVSGGSVRQFFDGRRPPGALSQTSAARRGTAEFESRATAGDPDRHIVIGDDRAACSWGHLPHADLRTGPRNNRLVPSGASSRPSAGRQSTVGGRRS
jgi:hypothetical protein